MQIKGTKLIQKSVTDPETGKMYSGYDSADCVPFVLDTDKIELHSTDRRRIMLPYVGHLPAEFEGAENPHILMLVRPGDVRIVLFADKGGKKLHAGLEATQRKSTAFCSASFTMTRVVIRIPHGSTTALIGIGWGITRLNTRCGGGSHWRATLPA